MYLFHGTVTPSVAEKTHVCEMQDPEEDIQDFRSHELLLNIVKLKYRR